MNTPLLALAAAGTALLASQLSARPEGMPPPPDPETVVVEMFAGYDADESNTLNQDELVAAFAGIRDKHRAERQGTRPRMGGLRGTGGDPNADRPMKKGNGKRRGPPAPETLAPELIEAHDHSGDGELDTEELLEAIAQLRERGPRGPARAGAPRAQ